MRTSTSCLAGLVWCALAMAAAPASAQYGATDGEWRTYAGDQGSTKYAPLDKINGLQAVDAKTGQPPAGFGVKSPPVILRDVVVAPTIISDFVTRKEAPPGWLKGIDARTGVARFGTSAGATFERNPSP